jgi:light-regulated signal transduction histidine kinase (bacteriophytochrome)
LPLSVRRRQKRQALSGAYREQRAALREGQNPDGGLTSANEEIQCFAYIVSHDLRAPLVNIMGFTSELEQATRTLTAFAETADMTPAAREAATEDIPEALRFIRASTSKMDRLVSAILKLSREGRRSLAVEPLDMAQLLEELVTTMRHQAMAKDVEVTVRPMPPLLADRVATKQIFGNNFITPGRGATGGGG